MPEDELRHEISGGVIFWGYGEGGDQTARPVLIGTWADAVWAIRFYEQRGFRVVSPEEKNRLLRTYWSVPERQTHTSVVLADAKWFASR